MKKREVLDIAHRLHALDISQDSFRDLLDCRVDRVIAFSVGKYGVNSCVVEFHGFYKGYRFGFVPCRCSALFVVM